MFPAATFTDPRTLSTILPGRGGWAASGRHIKHRIREETMNHRILHACAALCVAAAANGETLGNIQDLETLFVEQQYRFLPIGPPSEDVLVQPYGPVLPVDWQGFPEEFTKQMYAEMDSNGFPLYRISIYEDPVSRETVFLNRYGMEACRLAAEPGYDPYAWQTAWFNLESGQVLDEWSGWIYAPTHIDPSDITAGGSNGTVAVAKQTKWT